MERTQIIAMAESLLPEAWGEEIRLQIEATYENATTTVLRCRLVNAGLEAPVSIAVKHVRPHPENPTGYVQSLLNDWGAIKGCREAEDDVIWRSAMADAGARWHIFHALARVPTALKEDYQRGPTTLRQQVTAWLDAFAELADETCSYPALGQSAREMSGRLRELWPSDETSLPYYPAFSSF